MLPTPLQVQQELFELANEELAGERHTSMDDIDGMDGMVCGNRPCLTLPGNVSKPGKSNCTERLSLGIQPILSRKE